MGSNLQRFLGGSPGSVLVKLIFLSLLVGAFMAYLDVTPVDLVDHAVATFRALFGNGLDALRRVGLWVLYGAVVVVPIWLLSRLFGSRR